MKIIISLRMYWNKQSAKLVLNDILNKLVIVSNTMQIETKKPSNSIDKTVVFNYENIHVCSFIRPLFFVVRLLFTSYLVKA
jgi:hypothetical protein